MAEKDYTDRPDREALVGRYKVVVWRGFFRDRVTLSKDVWPALGGHMATWKLKRDEADTKFDELVAELVAQVKPETWQETRMDR